MGDSGEDPDGSGASSTAAAAAEAAPGASPLKALSLNRPRILLMGPQRSGKSSIQRVLFTKMSPHETLFLESTSSLSIKLVANNPFVQFEIWDFPADVNLHEGIMFEDQLLSPDLIFGNSAAIAFIIDAQDDPSTDALGKLHEIVTVARSVNPAMHFEIFIHKVDGDLFLSEDHKLEVQRDIQEQVELELEDIANCETEITLSFYLTSIYDHSVFEAFSKVVHKLIPQLPAMENLLNILIASCDIEKAFLFDVVSKIYVATDHNPVDISSYELCSDMIDVVIDVSCIYGMEKRADAAAATAAAAAGGGLGALALEAGCDIDAASDANDARARTPDGELDEAGDGAGAGADDEEADLAKQHEDADADGNADAATSAAVAGTAADDDDLDKSEEGDKKDSEGSEEADDGGDGGDGGDDGDDDDDDDDDDDADENMQKREDLAFDRESSSVIRLNNNMILYLKQVASYLALVCIVRAQNYEKQGIIDYNVECFRKALAALFAKKGARPATATDSAIAAPAPASSAAAPPPAPSS